MDGEPVPGANDEYLVYQTLVGAWPIDAGRLRAYVEKASREAKAWTSWISPNRRYDEAMARFTDAVLDARRSREFLRDFGEFHARVAHFGRVNSLAQTLVKITAPGVPDFYQGTELWDFSLVDPDNRRSVDWALRRRLLDELTAEIETTADRGALARRLASTSDEGRAKLYLIRQALGFRRQHRDLFLTGAYHPLEAVGAWAEHVCAFARSRSTDLCVVIVPRLLARRDFFKPVLPLGRACWDDTRVAVPVASGARLRDVLTGRTVKADDTSVAIGDALTDFPVALLERAS